MHTFSPSSYCTKILLYCHTAILISEMSGFPLPPAFTYSVSYRHFQYRHVFTEGPKKGSTYFNISISAASGDHQGIKCNTKFFATGVKGGGGPVLVYPLTNPGGAVKSTYPLLNGHTSDVSDVDFNPFNDNLLVSFRLVAFPALFTCSHSHERKLFSSQMAIKEK